MQNPSEEHNSEAETNSGTPSLEYSILFETDPIKALENFGTNPSYKTAAAYIAALSRSHEQDQKGQANESGNRSKDPEDRELTTYDLIVATAIQPPYNTDPPEEYLNKRRELFGGLILKELKIIKGRFKENFPDKKDEIGSINNFIRKEKEVIRKLKAKWEESKRKHSEEKVQGKLPSDPVLKNLFDTKQSNLPEDPGSIDGFMKRQEQQEEELIDTKG